LYEKSNPDTVLRKEALNVMHELNSGVPVETGYKKLQIITIARKGKLPQDIDKPESEYADKLKEYACKLEDQMNKGLSPNQACEKLKKYFKELKEKLPNTLVEISLGAFTVIVANPSNTEKAKRIIVTEAENAALFLWATTSNLKERIDLLEKWDFSLKSIRIKNTEKTSDIYFQGGMTLVQNLVIFGFLD
jgi:hypothetical protein